MLSSYVANCKVFPFRMRTAELVISLGASCWSLNVKQIRSKNMFSLFRIIFIRTFANKFVQYLLKTLQLATCFNPKPIDFRAKQSGSVQNLDYDFKKCEKSEFYHLCCQIREIFPHILFRIAFRISSCFHVQVNWSFFREKFLLIELKLRLICRRTCFFVVFVWILGPIITRICCSIFRNAYLIPCWVSDDISNYKINIPISKNYKKVKNLKIESFSLVLGHSKVNFYKKSRKFLFETRKPRFIIWSFLKLLFTNSF